MSGILAVVATPIGNFDDLSPRAVRTLATADLVCCEDTRRSGRLLERAGARGPRLLRVDEHTENAASAQVLEVLAEGGTVALITDAGTPGISDPGERLVRRVVAAGHAVTAVPGPSAVTAALTTSGLPANRFVFEGFLPRRGGDRSRRLAAIASEQRTVVVFESPRRLAATLSDLVDVCGSDRSAAVARELTKLHEETVRGSLAELASWAASGDVKGEVVVVIAGAPHEAPDDDDVRAAVRDELAAGSTTRDAAATVADRLDVARRRVYAVALDEAKGGVGAGPEAS